MSRVISSAQLGKVLKKIKNANKSIVVTNGCFDIIHSGHIDIFRKSKKLGDNLFVLLNSDKSIRKIKGKDRPIIKQKDRIKVLRSIKYIDYIIVFNTKTAVNLYKKIKPKFLTKGSQYLKKKIIGREIIEQNYGKIKLIKMIPKISTSIIVNKIKSL